MPTTSKPINPQQLSGQWIGQTMGCESPAHIWSISVLGHGLIIDTRWENESVNHLVHGEIGDDGASATIGKCALVMLDTHHFVVPKWDTNDRRGHKGAAYDVVFSRPGLAELTVPQVYKKYKKP